MNEQLDSLRIKGQLAAEVRRLLAERGLTDAAAADLLEVSADDLLRFRSSDESLFSIDRLIDMLNALDQNVGVHVVPGATPVEAALDETSSGHMELIEKIKALAARVPPEEWAKVPRDGAENYKKYLYGGFLRRESE